MRDSIKSRDIRKIEVRENVDIYPIIPYIMVMKGGNMQNGENRNEIPYKYQKSIKDLF